MVRLLGICLSGLNGFGAAAKAEEAGAPAEANGDRARAQTAEDSRVREVLVVGNTHAFFLSLWMR